MVALAREPLTMRDARKLVYGLLPQWGSILRDGTPRRSALDALRSGSKAGSALPAPYWFFDLSRAFAALNPATSGLADEGRTAWLVHAPLTDQQRAVWHYYVDGLGLEVAIDTARADKQQWAHDRDRELAKAAQARDWRGDDLVAARLHCTGRTAHRHRTEAVWAMAEFGRWDRDDACLDNGSDVA
jgi:hypothetical protein